MSRHITVEHGGITYIGKIATIRSTMLGYEDHGILTAMLDLDMAGSGVGFGGYCLDEPEDREDHRNRKRLGTAYGLDFIIRVMETVGVSQWEHVKNMTVLGLFKDEWGMCLGIASLKDQDRIFIPREHAEAFKTKTGA